MAGQIAIGEQLGLYRIVGTIGSGGTATVYLGRHIHLPRDAAIKVLTTSLTEEQVTHLFKEARTLASLEHPHIIRLFDFALSDDTPYLVMEYASRGSLRQRHASDARVPLQTIVAYVKQIASALEYSHQQGIIHRDIKPENILLNARGEVLLSDFGLATIEESASMRSGGNFAGTPAYIAPEQLLNKPSRASDQYSFAVVLYEWLCGHRPFRGTTLSVALQQLQQKAPPLRYAVPDLEPEIEQIVMRALEKDAFRRFDSVQSFADAFIQAAERALTMRGNRTSILPAYTGTQFPVISAGTSAPALTPLNTPSQNKVTPTSTPSSPAHLNTPTPGKVTPTEVQGSISSRPSLFAQEAREISRHLPASAPPITAPFQGRVPIIVLGSLLLVLFTLFFLLLPPVISNYQTSNSATATAQVQIARQKLQASATSKARATTQATALAIKQKAILAYAEQVKTYGMMEGFDQHRSGFNPYERYLSSTNIAQLTTTWSTALDERVDQSTPLIADGFLYSVDLDGTAYAIEANTGKMLWKNATQDPVGNSAPALANGVLYIGSRSGTLYALNAQNGNKIWSYRDPVLNNNTTFLGSPLIVNDVVYFSAYYGSIYAVNAKTGQKIWSYATGGQISGYAPSMDNGIIYYTAGAILFALEAKTGQIIATYKLNEYASGSPIVIDKIAYITTTLSVFALDLTKRQLVWRIVTANDKGISAQLALANNVLYIARANGMLAVDALSGKEKWHYVAGEDAFSYTPLVANDVVYICSKSGILYILNATTGNELFIQDAGKNFYNSSPVVANGVLYIASSDRNINAFSTPSA